MFGSVRDDAYGRLVGSPEDSPTDGGVGQSVCVVVADANEHCAHAGAAGARIEVEVKDETYGGRSCTCRDLEGHT